MKYGPLALSFDFGTQSVRAILFDKTGEIRGKEKIDYKTPVFFGKARLLRTDRRFLLG